MGRGCLGLPNQLLTALAKSDLALIQSSLESVTLRGKQVLEVPSSPIEHVYFVESGLVSVVATKLPMSEIDPQRGEIKFLD
jgi:CRP-like cAMP-binding protein